MKESFYSEHAILETEAKKLFRPELFVLAVWNPTSTYVRHAAAINVKARYSTSPGIQAFRAAVFETLSTAEMM